MAAGSGGFESFDGSSWTQLPSSVATASDVSCPESDFCMAVGATGSVPDLTSSVETWDGTSWSETASPPALAGEPLDLGQISCASSTFCEVGGSSFADDVSYPYLADWNGSSWTLVDFSTPYPSFGAGLGGVSSISCSGPSQCMEVVGNFYLLTDGTLIADPAGWEYGWYGAVTCPDTSSCLLVGDGPSGLSIASYSDGTWIPDSVQSASPMEGTLDSVSCTTGTSETFCVAVGEEGGEAGWTPLIESTAAMPAPAPAPTVTITPSANPAPAGPVTYTVAVSGGSGTPTGSVALAVQLSEIPSAVQSCSGVLVSGQFSCTLDEPLDEQVLTVPPQATYPVDAVYFGDQDDAPSAAQITETVVAGVATLSVAPAVDPAPSGPVAYDVSVSGTGPTPTGTVALSDGAGGNCSATLTDGAGTCRITEAASSTDYTVTAEYSGNPTYFPTTATTTETVEQSPSITSPGTATATAGTSFSFTVTTVSLTGVPDIKATGLPKGLVLKNNGNGTATISGTPSAKSAGVSTATITASAKGRTTAVQSLVFTVDSAPVFTSRAYATAHLGDALSFVVTTADGYPVPAMRTSSTLPAWLTLTDNGNGTAILSGTPPAGAAGTDRLTLVATNGVGSPVTQNFVLTVRA